MDNVLPTLLELPTNGSSSKRTYTAITRTGIASPSFKATSSLLKEGMRVLEIARDSPMALQRMIPLWYADYGDDANQGPIVKASWQAVEKTLLSDLRVDSSPMSVSQLCDRIFQRTSQSLRWPISPAGGALEHAFSADGCVRWETLGIYYALAGVVIAREGSDDLVLVSEKWGPDRKNAMERALDACLQCYSICERMGQINDFSIQLLMLAIMLTTWCYGDDSYQAWRLMGDVTSVVSALGYYGTAQDEFLIPPYLQEYRKLAMAKVHELDKYFATFVGRPPRINSRFTGLGLPLDLPDSATSGSPEVFAAAVARLDDKGWNRDGLIHAATRIRTVAILLELREEALELSLGSQTNDVSWQSRDLLSKSASTWASLPSHVKYTPSSWTALPPATVIALLSLRLESLYTEFILHKLLVNQNPANRSLLIEISHFILSLVLAALNQRTILLKHRIDLEWSMVYYAMPCASVLILELLRQTEQPKLHITISRSTLIQDLSVLISCCDWLTEPDQQNYGLCKRAQSIFSRSLDRILNPTPALAQPVEVPSQHEQLTARHDENSIGPGAREAVQEHPQHMSNDESEWMAWLETCNLQAEPWLDVFEGQPGEFQDGM